MTIRIPEDAHRHLIAPRSRVYSKPLALHRGQVINTPSGSLLWLR